MAAVLPGPHGPGVAGVARQPRLRTRGRAERAVPTAGVRDVRGRRTECGTDSDARRRLLHVGVRLSAYRQHVSELAADDRSVARFVARGRPPQDHGDELRRVVWLLIF